MSVVIVPKIMVEAFGGVDVLNQKIGAGEIHYSFMYPDGALEISTKDIDCLRILLSDPTANIVCPSAKIPFRSLAPFGSVRHMLVLPQIIERKFLRESLFVYPSTIAAPLSEEYNLSSICVEVVSKRYTKELASQVCMAFAKTASSVSELDISWGEIEPFRLCRYCVCEDNRIFALMNLTGLDQRVLNWFLINVLGNLLTMRKALWEIRIIFASESAIEHSHGSKVVDLCEIK